ncbi:MAG: D-2-hydroxyacid dehydrogenase [Cyclobacteriaceae bacterium]
MSDYHIVFLDTDTVGKVPNLERFRQFGSYTSYPQTQPEELSERIRDANIIISNKVRIDASAMDAAPSLQLICVAATGTNNIDLDAANKRNIPVKNVENYSTYSVAQFTIGTVLHLLHRTNYFDAYVKSGEYSHQKLFTHLGHEFWQLEGRQFGIIGLGNIGKQVARVAEALGATVTYYSTSGKNNNASYQQQSLEQLLESSDIISIHAPLNEHTQDLLRYEQLAMMQKHALLVNTGRGGIVNEADLVRAIDDERIGGAAVDVFSTEPFPESHPYLLVKYPHRLILTPHIGWASIEARTLLMDRVCQNIQEFIAEQA